MYNPQERLLAFLPLPPRTEYRPAAPAPKTKQRPSHAKKPRGLLMHVVDLVQFRLEHGKDHTTSIPEICDALAAKERHVICAELKSPAQAATAATTFGSGNLMVYAMTPGDETAPQYVALGVTEGCVVDGSAVRGTWRVLTCFGGRANPFTQAAVERAEEFHWDVLPRKTLASLLKKCFVRLYVSRFWETYDKIQQDRLDGVSAPEVVARDPLVRRPVLLAERLFTFASGAAQEAFLQACHSR